ncbi:MAG TPA: SGNH/GDSL hydrolase family protein [Chitinophagaceae bacterium]|nr:SGNH/GDSL hydrolase family protein [Chitinophagaceae bacterium]
MEKSRINRIFIFFITLNLLFWNPLTYYLLYRNTPAYPLKGIMLFYWIVFIAGVLLMLLIHKNRVGEKIKNIIFSGLVLSIAFAIVALVNFAMSRETEKEGLIFKPNTKVRYQTSEFDYTVSISSIGLRNPEITVEKSKFRILCFGDSWTYGWGVNMEDAWPAKLQTYLNSKGLDVEVINCGQAGIYSTIYAQYLKKLSSILKPDLVLIGMLQGDDLAQLYENDSIFNRTPAVNGGLKFTAKTFLKTSVANILTRRQPKQIEVKDNWKEAADKLLNGFSYLQKIRFHALPDSVQLLFKQGNLNPGLLDYYINFSDRMIIFNNPKHSATILASRKMDEDVRTMKQSFDNIVFVNLPLNFFTGHEVIRTAGDIMDPYFRDNNKIDSIYRAAAEKNSVPYIELTNHFLGLNKTEYFYRFDGHPNAKGYKEIADYIGEQLVSKGIIKQKHSAYSQK